MIHQQIIEVIDAELAEKSFEQLAQKANVSHPWPRALRRKLPHSIAKLEAFLASLGYSLLIIPTANLELQDAEEEEVDDEWHRIFPSE